MSQGSFVWWCRLSIAPSHLTADITVVVTEMAWSAKPKTFTIRPFTEEVCRALGEKELSGLKKRSGLQGKQWRDLTLHSGGTSQSSQT